LLIFRCLIHKPHLRFWRKFWEFSLMNYEIHTILWGNVIFFYFWVLNAKPELQWQMLNKNMRQKKFECFILDLKFSLSEHCEWGTWQHSLPILFDHLKSWAMWLWICNEQAWAKLAWGFVSMTYWEYLQFENSHCTDESHFMWVLSNILPSWKALTLFQKLVESRNLTEFYKSIVFRRKNLLEQSNFLEPHKIIQIFVKF
jgi:hypothetical protein